MKIGPRITPKSMAGQMIALLAISFALLLTVLTILEVREQDDLLGWAESDFTLDRLRRMKPVLEILEPAQLGPFLEEASSCHEGYSLTESPFAFARSSPDTERIGEQIVRALGLEPERVMVGHAMLTQNDFSYDQCGQTHMDFPFEGIVISIELVSGRWFHTEVHPHEWHIHKGMVDWLIRSSAAFVLVGCIAIFFIRRLSAPLNRLTAAAHRFGEGLQVSHIEERGPLDLKRAIQAFNAMQRQVKEEVARRTNTLAAISHDVRTPLTALRVKAELIEDAHIREDLITSIDKMEKITASALEFLKGESRAEPRRTVDLSALLDSECQDFSELGHAARYAGPSGFLFTCRPDALARAVRNLIENAIKYGGGARVTLRATSEAIEISIADQGPGIPVEHLDSVLEPFARLSKARESDRGGFGLGLAVAQSIARGHEGELVLAVNEPRGLVATLQLPVH